MPCLNPLTRAMCLSIALVRVYVCAGEQENAGAGPARHPGMDTAHRRHEGQVPDEQRLRSLDWRWASRIGGCSPDPSHARVVEHLLVVEEASYVAMVHRLVAVRFEIAMVGNRAVLDDFVHGVLPRAGPGVECQRHDERAWLAGGDARARGRL